MADKVLMKNKHGVIKKAYIGFSWTCLFFGFFVAMWRGDWKHAFMNFGIAMLVGVFTLGIGSLIFFVIWAKLYNRLHMRRLLADGYSPTGSAELVEMAYRSAS